MDGQTLKPVRPTIRQFLSFIGDNLLFVITLLSKTGDLRVLVLHAIECHAERDMVAGPVVIEGYRTLPRMEPAGLLPDMLKKAPKGMAVIHRYG